LRDGMDASEDTENGSSSGSEEEGARNDHKPSQQTESESEEEDPEPAPEPPRVVKRKVNSGTQPAKRSKGGIKGALSAYLFYWMEAQPILKAEHPTVNHKDLAKLCGQNWKTLSLEEKQPFLDKASADKTRYESEREAGVGVESKMAAGDGKPSRRAAYVLYCKEHKAQLKRENPGLTPSEYRKMLSERWKGLGAEDKRGYTNRAYGHTSAVAQGNGTGDVVDQIDELLAHLRKRVEARMLRADIGYHEMKGLLEIVCKASNYELLRRLDAYPS